MSAAASGLWRDQSQNVVLGATLTLPIQQANLLLAALAFLVTLAGGSVWNLVALLIHSMLVRGKESHVLGLQHQVALRNSGSSAVVVFHVARIHLAWLGRGVPNLWKRTAGLLLPALFIWATFAAASIFTSRVALGSQSEATIARLQANNCGFFNYNTTTIDGFLAYMSKMTNDTLQARNYVNTFYNNATTSPTGSTFKSLVLPHKVETASPCPFPNADRCIGGHNAAMNLSSGFLDSYEDLGINSNAGDRVTFQYSVACSPIHGTDLAKNQVTSDNQTWIDIYFGPLVAMDLPYTYEFEKATSNTLVGYILSSMSAYVSSAPDDINWVPIADFNRTDADVTVFFLSANHILYLHPTLDPWFMSSGVRNITSSFDNFNLTGYWSDYLLNSMMCTEQYVLCNPTTGSCSTPGGINQFNEVVIQNRMGLNPAQQSTAFRIGKAMIDSNIGTSVTALGSGALWAHDLLSATLSPGLPDNQWQLEALGWFQTSMVKLQAYMMQYASQSDDLGPYGGVELPRAFMDQCSNQLVRTSGEVQNFSFLGIMIIVCFSIAAIVLSLSVEPLLDWSNSHRRQLPRAAVARQADSMLHLLRLALPDSEMEAKQWEAGPLGRADSVNDAYVNGRTASEYVGERGEKG
ncbi:hypothetical protein GQ53DRAFT_788429 [Thozetella sp. PMI_491]|nr:hypothetical protein GQ53DRAFT_788429 [Thozetella sp. PMI_491]